MAIKGFNKIAVPKGSGEKRTRILTDAVKEKKLAKKLEQLDDGRVCISLEDQKYKTFDRYPDLFVEKALQALKYGGTPGEIRAASKDTLDLFDRKEYKIKALKEAIYGAAKSMGLGGQLSEVAEIFGLEEVGTRVVDSGKPDMESSDSEQAAQ